MVSFAENKRIWEEAAVKMFSEKMRLAKEKEKTFNWNRIMELDGSSQNYILSKCSREFELSVNDYFYLIIVKLRNRNNIMTDASPVALFVFLILIYILY